MYITTVLKKAQKHKLQRFSKKIKPRFIITKKTFADNTIKDNVTIKTSSFMNTGFEFAS